MANTKKKATAKVAAKKTTAKKPAAKTAAKKAPAKAAPKKAAAKVVAKKAPMKPAVKAPVKKAAPAPKAARPIANIKAVSESKTAMGRGLGALLSADGIPENKRDSVVELKINDISPNNGQPRKIFNDESLNELANSIQENGVIQPIIVQRKGDGYRIVAGERRWRAARIAGLSVIPAIVRDLTDRETIPLKKLLQCRISSRLISSHRTSLPRSSVSREQPLQIPSVSLTLMNHFRNSSAEEISRKVMQRSSSALRKRKTSARLLMSS